MTVDVWYVAYLAAHGCSVNDANHIHNAFAEEAIDFIYGVQGGTLLISDTG